MWWVCQVFFLQRVYKEFTPFKKYINYLCSGSLKLLFNLFLKVNIQQYWLKLSLKINLLLMKLAQSELLIFGCTFLQICEKAVDNSCWGCNLLITTYEVIIYYIKSEAVIKHCSLSLKLDTCMINPSDIWSS